ncbi:Hypothetical predicted protein [Marmota monax]|uniref:BCL2 like 12 n=1 Tax=Marmota monax TaxID=9995 RepID=A0A5E4BCZ7_MARMO|nr:Hypothetical predicted protein [Marmota monax]
MPFFGGGGGGDGGGRWRPEPGASMAGSEELGLREDTLRVLAAFLRRGEASGSPIPTPPSVILSAVPICLSTSMPPGSEGILAVSPVDLNLPLD